MRYDYVDIGTCDFEVADGIFSQDKSYLLVEPMVEYLDRLPTGNNIKKETSACSCNNGSINIFYVPEEDIIRLGLPMWMKGCSKIGEAHKVTIQYLRSNNIDLSIIKSKKINVISFIDLVSKYNISEIGILKIDTEGHDHIILKEVAKLIKSNQLLCDTIIVEYIIGAFGNTDAIDDIVFSLRKILPNVKIKSENLTISK